MVDKKNWSDIAFFFQLIVYKLGLDYIYKNMINPTSEYAGFISEISNQTIFLSWFTFVVFSLIGIKIRKINGIVLPQVLLLFLLFVIIPSSSFFLFVPVSSQFYFGFFIYWLLIFILSISKTNIFRAIKISPNPQIIMGICLLMTFSVLVVSGIYANFRIHFSLNDVYDLREEASNFSLPIVLDYLWSAASNVIPVCMIYYLNNKQQKIAWFLAFIVLLNFSINGSKSTLFKMIICLMLFYIGRKNYIKILPTLFIAVIFIAVLEFFTFQTGLFADIVIRRAFYVPSLLDTYYYEYISSHGPTFFSKSVNIAFDIGQDFFNKDTMRCNNGLYSEAFKNLGWLGLFIYPILLSFFIKLCDKFTKNISPQIAIFLSVTIVLALRSSDFTTCLFTHGLLLTIITAIYMPKETMNYKFKLNK